MAVIHELEEIVKLFVEEMDDPCRRNQYNPGAVYISVALELRARKAVA